MSEELESLKQAAEEVGLSTSEPVFYEVVVPTNKDSFWWFSIVACSLDGSRVVVWTNMYVLRWFGKLRAKRYANIFAAESDTGPLRAWIGETRRTNRHGR